MRAERPGDAAAIRQAVTAAFGQTAEADLVERLRADGEVVASLVAAARTAIVGHILFSRLDTGGRCAAAALAPLAVVPGWQRRGIGAALVRAGIDACRDKAVAVLVVLGDPAFYGRFGFTRALGARLRTPYDCDALTALELVPGALAAGAFAVRYPRAFAALG
ncbi:MAG: N-acetyltransferase [Alphaproteobacteria bacterium]|nr:N-acetyltransferase [Alphaproteobacteria bacterium]